MWIRTLRRFGGIGAALVVAASACKRSDDASSSLTSSLMFDSGSPEAREALGTRVDFVLTEENFAQWERAQEYLDALPRSAIPKQVASGGNAVDRAVARLEASPRARTAIERTGLSVRDFVLETIALAQATEAAETGKSTSATPIPQANFQFVQRYRARTLLARRQERMSNESQNDEMQSDTSTSSESVDSAMDHSDSQHGMGYQGSPDTAKAREPIRDSVRDTVPPPTNAPTTSPTAR
jgi:hypothetical protein